MSSSALRRHPEMLFFTNRDVRSFKLPEGRTASEGVGTCPSRCRGSSSSSACTHRAPQSAQRWSEPLTAPEKRGIRLVGLFVCLLKI